MKNFLPSQYNKNSKLKLNHSYLVEQFADYSKIFKEIQKVVKKGDYTLGGEVDKFEKNISKITGAKFAIGVGNGTDALYLSLKALGIGRNDEVITTPFTFIATVGSIVTAGAKPIFVDIKEDYNINEEKIEKAITKKTKAIMFIDYGGNPSDINKILKIGKKYGLKIIQDGAQSLGARYNGKPVGANAEISTMSFHMAKILSCIEGGMIFTNSKKYRDEILMRRSHGEEKPGDYIHHILGTNARLTDLQAAIGLSQFKKLKF